MADEAKTAKSGMVPMAAVFAAVSMFSVGMGWYIGSEIRHITETQIAAMSAAAEPAGEARKDGPERQGTADAHGAARSAAGGEEGAGAGDGHGSSLSLFSGAASVKLEPIVANIGATGEEWIRVEVAILFGEEGALGTEEEKYNISEAIVGMLRSKTKDDLSGPSAFLQFREDLTDTVMIATGGRAESAKILSLVVE